MIDYSQWFNYALIVAILIVLDIVSGFIQGVVNKKVDSAYMLRGLIRKSGIVLGLILAGVCEYGMLYIDLGFTIPMVSGVVIFVCVMEIVSIIENIIKIDPRFQNNKFLSIFNIKEDK